MAWTYGNWRRQTTLAGKISQLRLHLEEVADKIGPEVGAHGYSRGSGSLTSYMQGLEKQLVALEASGGGVGLARIRDARTGRSDPDE